METKICPRCKEVKPTTEYQKNRAAKDGLQYHCKSCRSSIDKRLKKREYDKNRYHSNKDLYLDQYYLRIYGISLEEYNKMLVDQQNVCCVCKKECSSGKRLAVDHCHSTGKVRGLLCIKCNQALGLLEDNPVLIKKLLQYAIIHARR